MSTKLEGFLTILGIIFLVSIALIIGPKFLYELNILIYHILAYRIGNVLTTIIQLVLSAILVLTFIFFWRSLFILVFKY
ncbi:MAG: hypothetical protein JTT12_03465, partial [Candidatus Brockarchaeota archaeon]|nr:hypothetical protein [Candidatus Brockarchaeota archaeon]